MINLDLKKFVISDQYFDHPSLLHGAMHTYRVMCHALRIGEMMGLNSETAEAFCAAYIHDMARQHDGYCTQHGGWAAQRKLPLFSAFFQSLGINQQGLLHIKIAITNHSLHNEITHDHSAYFTTALLKDADALDRIRIGEDNLNINYLRFKQSQTQIDFAKRLFYATDTIKIGSFEEIWHLAKELN
jgi:HD superfamily phosphodiesterase